MKNKFVMSHYQNSDFDKQGAPDQTALIGAVCSGSTLFASIVISSVMVGNYLQQSTFSDAFFSWRFKVLAVTIAI